MLMCFSGNQLGWTSFPERVKVLLLAVCIKVILSKIIEHRRFGALVILIFTYYVLVWIKTRCCEAQNETRIVELRPQCYTQFLPVQFCMLEKQLLQVKANQQTLPHEQIFQSNAKFMFCSHWSYVRISQLFCMCMMRIGHIIYISLMPSQYHMNDLLFTRSILFNHLLSHIWFIWHWKQII